ncbi:MAG TPA: hypothetical protein VD863_05645 [Bradyrhizobium sp.]|jgi:hypothetical protein|nr:hypothetical protein [Bradyrhizobium sp.]
MANEMTFNPKDFSVEVLEEATRGRSHYIKPQLAVVLLKAKLGAGAESYLAACACDEGLDVRVRRVAIEELAPFSGAKELLKALTESGNPWVSEAASQALGGDISP